jgi:DNA-binding Lrp family transcriptional regulator
MEPLDFAIYRHLSPHGEARFWAGRRVIDPTISAREIAERVGISENGVRARIRGLTDRGFLRGKIVIPNPSLFAARVYVAELPLEGTIEAQRVFRDLALVDGVVFARDTLDEGNRLVRVHFVSDRDSTTARRAALIRRLSPNGQLRAPQPYAIPVCERDLSPLDWRLLEAFFKHPEASLAETARAVRISLKTAARRYHELIDTHACWWTHGPDAEEFPLALIRVDVETPAHRDPVAGQIQREALPWMPVAHDGLGLDPSAAATVVAGLVPADAPILLERLIASLGALRGVVTVRRTFALGSAIYSSWFAERVAEHIPHRA